ncbi:MAG: hypothetical protein P8176_01440 [Gammaproteobacteria bacterium]
MTSNTDINFNLAFNQSGSPLAGGSKFSYDSSTKTFNLDHPLTIGTLEQLGDSAASSFFGGDFPDTSTIPVLGTLLNKISFTINTFTYTEGNTNASDTYNVAIEGDISGVDIGTAKLTSATISLKKTA